MFPNIHSSFSTKFLFLLAGFYVFSRRRSCPLFVELFDRNSRTLNLGGIFGLFIGLDKLCSSQVADGVLLCRNEIKLVSATRRGYGFCIVCFVEYMCVDTLYLLSLDIAMIQSV